MDWSGTKSDCRCDCSYENVNTTIHRDANAKYGADAVGATGNGATSRTLKQAPSAKRPEAAQRHLSEVTAIWKKYECHPVKSLAPLLVSAPLFVSFYFAISRMADGIGSFKDGGAFWFTVIRRGSNHDDASVDVRFIFSLGQS